MVLGCVLAVVGHGQKTGAAGPDQDDEGDPR
jgi:hypothetical protein